MPIVPFSLSHLLLIRELGQVCVSLCPSRAWTRPCSLLWRALMSFWAFDDEQTFTFVLDDAHRGGKRLRGVVQAIQPAARPEMTIHYLAPHLAASEEAGVVWRRLLNHVAAFAGEKGIHRVFSCAPEGSAELEAMLGAGFSVYTREDIFRLPPDAHPQTTPPVGIRPEQDTDAWAIKQLYRAVAPHLVQQAEAIDQDLGEGWRGRRLASRADGEGFVLTDDEGIAGYGHLASGRAGHWLTIQVHPRVLDRVDELLDYGLALLNYYPTRPVYCEVREYQGGVRVPLEKRGFQYLATYCCLVRHTTVRIQEVVRSLVPALEKQAKAPTTSVSSSHK